MQYYFGSAATEQAAEKEEASTGIKSFKEELPALKLDDDADL